MALSTHRSVFGRLWFRSADLVEAESPMVDEAADCGVRHLLLGGAVILLLHGRRHVLLGLLLDDGVTRVAGQLGPQDGGQDGRGEGVALLEVGRPGHVPLGLGQEAGQRRARQRVQIRLGRGHRDVADAVCRLRGGGARHGGAQDGLIPALLGPGAGLLLVLLDVTRRVLDPGVQVVLQGRHRGVGAHRDADNVGDVVEGVLAGGVVNLDDAWWTDTPGGSHVGWTGIVTKGLSGG